MAAALFARAGRGDRRKAAGYLADLAYAQQHGPNGDGSGIDAALHVGATAWYAIAALASNPLRLLQ